MAQCPHTNRRDLVLGGVVYSIHALVHPRLPLLFLPMLINFEQNTEEKTENTADDRNNHTDERPHAQAHYSLVFLLA